MEGPRARSSAPRRAAPDRLDTRCFAQAEPRDRTDPDNRSAEGTRTRRWRGTHTSSLRRWRRCSPPARDRTRYGYAPPRGLEAGGHERFLHLLPVERGAQILDIALDG